MSVHYCWPDVYTKPCSSDEPYLAFIMVKIFISWSPFVLAKITEITWMKKIIKFEFVLRYHASWIPNIIPLATPLEGVMVISCCTHVCTVKSHSVELSFFVCCHLNPVSCLIVKDIRSFQLFHLVIIWAPWKLFSYSVH